MKLILGSKSKGRRKMLEEMGLAFDVMPSEIDEKAIRVDDPKRLVLALANAKADALVSRISEPAILVTSDQVVVWEGKIREKPENEQEAKEFLRGYAQSPAETVTSVVVTSLATGKRKEAVDVAKVYFHPFSEQEIQDLISSGDVFNLAGAFTIDGEKWEKHVERIEGTRDSVIGMPKELTKKLIQEVDGNVL